MQTTKNDMAEYLLKLQKLQQMAMGIADITLKVAEVDRYTFIDITLFPRDHQKKRLKDKEGEPVLLSNTISGWRDKEENDKELKQFMTYLKIIGVL